MPVLHYVTFYAQSGVCVALIGSLEECVGVAALRWPDRRCVIGAGLSLSAGRTASCVSGSDSVSAGHQSTNQHRRLVLSGQTLVYMEHCRSLYQRSSLS